MLEIADSRDMKDQSSVFINIWACTPRGCDVMLQRVCTSPGNRYTCTIFVDSDLVSRGRVRVILPSYEGGLCRK